MKPLEKSQLKNWREYLDYEIKQGDHQRIIFLFERCMISCALYEDMWIKVCLYVHLCVILCVTTCVLCVVLYVQMFSLVFIVGSCVYTVQSLCVSMSLCVSLCVSHVWRCT